MSHCIGGTLWKFAIVRLVVPTLWPIQKGTKLTQFELTILEEVRFSFNHLRKTNAQNWFGSQSSCSNNSPCAYYNELPQSSAFWCKLLAYNSWWQKGEMTFNFQNNTLIIGRLASYFSSALFPPLLMSPYLGIDEFTILFQMTNDTMWLLEISLDVHVYALWQCW